MSNTRRAEQLRKTNPVTTMSVHCVLWPWRIFESSPPVDPSANSWCLNMSSRPSPNTLPPTPPSSQLPAFLEQTAALLGSLYLQLAEATGLTARDALLLAQQPPDGHSFPA